MSLYIEVTGVLKNRDISDTEVIASLKSFLLKKAEELFESGLR